MLTNPWLACLFTVGVMIIGIYMVLNLFLAILLANLDQLQEAPPLSDDGGSVMGGDRGSLVSGPGGVDGKGEKVWELEERARGAAGGAVAPDGGGGSVGGGVAGCVGGGVKAGKRKGVRMLSPAMAVETRSSDALKV